MIQSFSREEAFRLFTTRRSRRWRDCLTLALRTLDQMEAAVMLDDLRVPPGNRLELQRGDREGQHSIRINDTWRICFVWKDDGPHDLEIVEHHQHYKSPVKECRT